MNLLLRSQLIVSLCALALAMETIMVLGLSSEPWHLLLILSATMLIYNLAQVRFNISRCINKKLRLSLIGHRLNVILAIVSFIITVPLITMINVDGLTVFTITSIFAILYVMPFTYKNERIKGLREIPVLKNILLSVVWALATVMIPLSINSFDLYEPAVIWMAFRRFLFVYALTVIFDIRDKKHDQAHGIWTLPMGVGIKYTKLLAITTLAVFILSCYLDPYISTHPLINYRESLVFSSLATMALITLADVKRKNTYYIVIVDGAMILQFFIVVGFSLINF